MSSLDEIATKLRYQVQRHGLTADDVDSFLTSDGFLSEGNRGGIPLDSIRNEARTILAENRGPTGQRQLAALCRLVDHALDLTLAEQVKPQGWRRALSSFRVVFSTVLILGVLYMLLGGLFVTYPSSWLSRMVAFGLLMILLGIYEGLQISVALLRLKDPMSLRGTFPRAFRLHALFRSEKGTRKFFAGRQFFVVVIVFLAARITAIPTPSSFPFSNEAIPDWFSSTIGVIFWNYGLAGALFTLWVGQLAPQFVANRAPTGFLDIPGMGIALKCAIALDDLGVTLPGTWIADAVSKAEEHVPLSAREIYRQYVEEAHGYGLLGIKKTWVISRASANLTYQAAGTFHRQGIEKITDDGLVVRGAGHKPSFAGYIIGEDGERRVLQHTGTAADRENDCAQFHQTVAPQRGSFLLGDTLVLETRVKVDSPSRTDVITISRPTKYVAFRLVFNEAPNELSRVVVIKNELDPVRGEFKRTRETELQVSDHRGSAVCEFIDFYPPLDSQYVLRWNHENDHEPSLNAVSEKA